MHGYCPFRNKSGAGGIDFSAGKQRRRESKHSCSIGLRARSFWLSEGSTQPAVYMICIQLDF